MDDVSSCLGDPSLETTQHISSDHMDMCRFSGSDDVEYRKVAAALDHIHTRITKASVNPILPGLCPAFVPEPSLPLSESHRRALIDSLWHHTIDTRYATIKSAHARTCEWLLKKTEYQDWLDINKTQNHHGVLWIKGKPGSGKSTLVKFAVANARKTRAETAVISFFFNARGEDLEKSTLGMYRSLLYQILNMFPYLQTVLDCLRPTVPREGETYRWEKDDLQNLFAAAVENLGQRRLMCFIDALDECEEDQIRDLVAFLEHLGRLATSSRIHFYVCLSSRHYPHISIENGVEMTLEDQEDHVLDITKYLNGTLKAGRGKQSEQIKEELLRRSSGVFLWVVLVVQILNKEYDHGRIHGLRKRLGELPDGLEKLFEEILTRDQENMEELILCLQWILYAERPLRQEEVYYAILSGTDPEALTSTPSEEITTQDMERFILSCSKGLAETTRLKARTVQFIHESVREFLLGKNGFNKLRLELGCGLSHDRLKQCCYNCMMIDTSAFLPSNMELPVASSEEAKGLRKTVSQELPFLDYAVHNVLYHADVADGQGVTQKAVLEKFALSKWILIDNLFEKFQIRRHTPHASLLYILAEKNFSNLIRTQLERESDPDTAIERCGDERYINPLNAALNNSLIDETTIQALLIPKLQSPYDHVELHDDQSGWECERIRAAIRILFKKRSTFSPRDGRTLMHWAALGGHEAVIDLLLSKKNVDLDPKDSDNWTPLSCAASRGHETVVKLLLSKGVDPDSKDRFGQSPLSWAALRGHRTIASLLLSKGVDPDSKDSQNRSPLSYAAEEGHEAVVNILLSKGVDPDSQDINHRSPLSYAAKEGHEAVVDLLLSRDVDPDSKDNRGQSPLSRAAEKGHDTVVNLLISKGVDPDAKDSNIRSPLSYAAKEGHEAVVDLLLSKDVDPDSKDMNDRTPLSYAVEKGHEAVTNILLSKDVDPDSQDNYGRSPLSRAAEKGRETIVNLLILKGADPDSKETNGRTPLSYAVEKAARFGRFKIVDLLLSKGADLNIHDSENRTPLFYAVKNGNERSVGFLLSNGADPEAKIHGNRTALSYAAEDGYETVVHLLLSKGADLNSKDTNDRTPLFHAVLYCKENVVRLLLSKGADPHHKDAVGLTPLALAISSMHEGIIKLLRANVKPDPNEEDAGG